MAAIVGDASRGEQEGRGFTLDRYIAATDRAIADAAHLDELLNLFAVDAVVALGDDPVRGAEAVRELYRDFVAMHAEATHLWTTSRLPDGRERAEWACVARTADGSLVTASGVEYATVGSDGRIMELRNHLTRPPG